MKLLSRFGPFLWVDLLALGVITESLFCSLFFVNVWDTSKPFSSNYTVTQITLWKKTGQRILIYFFTINRPFRMFFLSKVCFFSLIFSSFFGNSYLFLHECIDKNIFFGQLPWMTCMLLEVFLHCPQATRNILTLQNSIVFSLFQQFASVYLMIRSYY